MFKLIRKISYGVIPRPDRPWEEDATSNAPQKRKRRLSTDSEAPRLSISSMSSPQDVNTGDVEREDDGEAKTKKLRMEDGMDVSESVQAPISAPTKADKRKSLGFGFPFGMMRSKSQQSDMPPPVQPEQETDDVKAVTKGVNEVELEDKEDVVIQPESVPLPVDEDDDLEERDADHEEASEGDNDSVVLVENPATDNTGEPQQMESIELAKESGHSEEEDVASSGPEDEGDGELAPALVEPAHLPTEKVVAAAA